ncbi:BUD13 homolog [Periplaneta americana]|uniref:BUD13 homolog n=1 Tax=Periplaneta americana TaxID=6978 RepID=UPI0037E6F9BE
MAVTQLSQKDYLKKYLSSGSDDKKKKKKKKVAKPSNERFRVVDDDIDLNNMRPLDEDEVDLYNLAEDAPQIAGIIDERPDDMRTLEEFRTKKWKIMSDENGIEDIKVTAIGGGAKQLPGSPAKIQGKSGVSDMSPKAKGNKKNSNKHSDPDASPVRKYKGDSDTSPPRKSKGHSDSDVSPPRKSKGHSDSDTSPPRKSKGHSDSDTSPPRKSKGHSDSDTFPPRKSKGHSDSDTSPPRRSQKRVNVDKLQSRRNKKESDSDVSPPRIRKYGSEVSPKTSKSPVRKEGATRSYSPVRKNKHDADMSPVRRSREGDLSPVRKNKLVPDLSPVRKGKHDVDLTLARKSRNGSEQSFSSSRRSPPRKMKHFDSPPRRPIRSEEYEAVAKNSRGQVTKTSRNLGKNSDSDSSPPRKASRSYNSPSLQSGKEGSRASSSNKSSRNIDSDYSGKSQNIERQGESNRQGKDFSQKRYSVSPSRRDISESPYRKSKRQHSPESESRKSRRNSGSDNSPHRTAKKSRFASPTQERSNSGDGGKADSEKGKAKSKMERTLDGKRAGLQDAKELKEEISSFRRREDQMFAQMADEVSGKGAAAVMRDRKTGKRRNLEEEAKQKQEEEEKMAEHREKYSRWGKGLKQVEDQKENLQHALHEMSKPLARYADDEDLEQHLRNQEREGDPMLEYIRSKKTEEDTTKSKPKYKGSYLPNRFGIPPGYRWDGVDRSNGYEKKWFEHQNSRKAVDDEAYKWSTADM